MNLAAKIDRVRGKPVAHESDALVSRLKRLRPGVDGRAPGVATVATLRRAVQADRETDGVLLRSREYPLPSAGFDPAALSMLPEVYGLRAPDWVYIDTETTGLSGGAGNLAFMVGVARYAGDRGLEVRQYVLANFAAEARMLRELSDWVGRDAVLVSYNGKCFDLPLLAARMRMHRIAGDPATLPHLDLMYSVRRAYRRHWPDCRLQTAEKRLLDLHRIGDLAGAEAPAAWLAWLRCGVTTQLVRVLEHNYQDVASLALLHQRLLHDYAGSGRPGLNHAGIGKAWRAAGQDQLARRVWEGAGSALDDDGRLQLAALYRQHGQWAQAENLWLDLHARGNAAAALELSKYYEHRKRDYRKAIDFARHCSGPDREARAARLRDKIVRGDVQLPLWNAVVSTARDPASGHEAPGSACRPEH